MDEKRQFMISCFHQDWVFDYDSWMAAVDDYVGRTGAGRALAIADSLGALAAMTAATATPVQDLGACVVPERMGYSDVEFLRAVVDRLRLAASEHQEQPVQ